MRLIEKREQITYLLEFTEKELMELMDVLYDIAARDYPMRLKADKLYDMISNAINSEVNSKNK